jgi:dTDP-4-dehydrorhamnose reductase
MDKILIFGASGLLGDSLYNILQKKYNVIGTYNSKYNDTLYKFDDNSNINDFINIHKPTICIFCICMRDVLQCEKDWDKTKKINIDLIDNISKICYEKNIYLIYFSSKYVFSGSKKKIYYEYDIPNPIQNYGISKYISELRIINNYNNNLNYLILRLPMLYNNHQNKLTESPMTYNIKKIFDRRHIYNINNNVMRTPLNVNDLSNFISDIIHIDNRIYGTHNFSNPHNKFTIFEILNKSSNILNISLKNIKPTNLVEFNDDIITQDSNIKNNKIMFSKFDDDLIDILNKYCIPKINNKNYNEYLFIFNKCVTHNIYNFDILLNNITAYNVKYIFIDDDMFYDYIINFNNIYNYKYILFFIHDKYNIYIKQIKNISTYIFFFNNIKNTMDEDIFKNNDVFFCDDYSDIINLVIY